MHESLLQSKTCTLKLKVGYLHITWITVLGYICFDMSPAYFW